MELNFKNIIFHSVAFLLGLSIILGLIYYIGTNRFLDTIHQTSPIWILIAIIIYSISWIFRTYRLRLLTAKVGKKISLYELFKLHISGYALNILLPAKIGDAVTVGYLKLKGIAIGKSAAIVLQTRILDAFALALLSLPAIVKFLNTSAPSWIQNTIILCFIIVTIPLCIVIFDDGRFISKTLDSTAGKTQNSSLKLVVEKIQDAYEGYCEIMTDRKLLLSTIVLSLAIWFIDCLTCYVVSIAVDVKIPIIITLLAVSIGNMGKSVPATPGSIGIYESMLAATLIVLGVSVQNAIAVAILDHALKNIFTLLIGIPMTASMGLDNSRISFYLSMRRKQDEN